jgi:hypothetical protein
MLRLLMTATAAVVTTFAATASPAVAAPCWTGVCGGVPIPIAAVGRIWIVPLQTDVPPIGTRHGYAATFNNDVLSTNPDVVFNASAIDFYSSGPGQPSYTIGGFLSSLGAVPSVGLGAPTYSPLINPILKATVTANTLLYDETRSPGGTIPNYATYFEITGNIILGTGDLWYDQTSTFVINHDDGVSLKLNGSLVPDCTGGVTTQCFTSAHAAGPEWYTWTGAPGLVSFDLVYSEGWGGTAFLQLGVLPEPATLSLMAASLAGLGLARRRRGA